MRVEVRVPGDGDRRQAFAVARQLKALGAEVGDDAYVLRVETGIDSGKRLSNIGGETRPEDSACSRSGRCSPPTAGRSGGRRRSGRTGSTSNST